MSSGVSVGNSATIRVSAQPLASISIMIRDPFTADFPPSPAGSISIRFCQIMDCSFALIRTGEPGFTAELLGAVSV